MPEPPCAGRGETARSASSAPQVRAAVRRRLGSPEALRPRGPRSGAMAEQWERGLALAGSPHRLLCLRPPRGPPGTPRPRPPSANLEYLRAAWPPAPASAARGPPRLS